MYGATVLQTAASQGRSDIVRLLLAEEGVDATIADVDGYTALHKASAFGCADCARALVAKAPATLSALTATGATPAQARTSGVLLAAPSPLPSSSCVQPAVISDD